MNRSASTFIAAIVGIALQSIIARRNRGGCDCNTRLGAACKDGTVSRAIGHGTCSHHGGVKFWVHRKGRP